MSIWSAEINDLTSLLESLKGQLPDLENELERLVKSDDENMILLYSRRSLEVIVTDLCETELDRPRKTEPLKGIIDKLNKEEKIPSNIVASMLHLNSLSSFGAHPKDYDPRQVKPVLNNLTTIVEWYANRKDFGYNIPENKKEDRKRDYDVSQFENSIAVLPFQDMSPQKDQDYFCDGIAEEILNALAHVESLKVIARTSSFAFKNKNEDMRSIGKKLDVETLLEGSIRKAGSQLRITAQLIKVADGSHIWSERYDRELKDVFAIQDEISLAIVDNLKIKLLGNEKAAMVKHHTEDLEAYMLFLRGRQSRQRKDLDGFNQALEYLEKCIALDRDFADAYAEIAFTYILMGWFCCTTVNDNLREKIIYNANKALELDENISDAHIALALTWELFDLDQVKAEKFARQAVRLNPGNSEAIQEHGFILGRMGNFEAAVEKMQSTIALDPLSVLAHNGLGYVYFYQGHFNSAIKQMQNILAIDPTFFPAHLIRSLSLTELEDYTQALQEINKCPQSSPVVTAHRGYIYAKLGRIAEVRSTIQEIEKAFSEDPLLEFLLAVIHTGMDDLDNAFDWLQKSQDKYGFIYRDRTIGDDYRINKLKQDPRFNELIYS